MQKRKAVSADFIKLFGFARQGHIRVYLYTLQIIYIYVIYYSLELASHFQVGDNYSHSLNFRPPIRKFHVVRNNCRQ